jgi:hypothetical protein
MSHISLLQGGAVNDSVLPVMRTLMMKKRALFDPSRIAMWKKKCEKNLKVYCEGTVKM